MMFCSTYFLLIAVTGGGVLSKLNVTEHWLEGSSEAREERLDRDAAEQSGEALPLLK